MRLQWIPSNIEGSISPANNAQLAGALGSMFLYSDVDTYNTIGFSDNQVITLDSS